MTANRGTLALFPMQRQLPPEMVERDSQILDYLNQQYEPVTISQIADVQKGSGLLRDYKEFGGLGIPASQVRMALERLILAKKVERLPPKDRSTAHLFVAL